MADIAGLLIKVRGDGAAFAANKRILRFKTDAIEPILSLPPELPAGMGADAVQGATWLKIGADFRNSENPWDDAHAIVDRGSAFAAAGGPQVLAIEPDLVQRWDYKDANGDRGMAASASPVCAFDASDGSGRKSVGPRVAWNAGAAFSQFEAARQKVGDRQSGIIVAHLDTGFDPAHQTRPVGIVDKRLWRNFVDDGHDPSDAVDHAPAGTLTSNRGHGTGTLSLLAGNRLDGTSPGWQGFSDYVGGAPLVQIIPVRVADWVVRFSTSTIVQGFEYARQQGAHVLSMSMGGLSSAALVDAVNLAYEHGVVMVTAAGNNYAGILSPKSIVFPARYQRVLAACGVMSDGRSYSGLEFKTMQGNYGPDSKMGTALGAFTPNVPWAEIDCGKIVDMDGAGTSAATPQIAAAAALWLAEHWDTVKNYAQPWMRVEAVRHALFSKALKSTAKMNARETFEKIGQGVLQAEAALAVLPLAASKLKKLPSATDSWSWLNLLIGGGVSLAPSGPEALQKQRMLALELTQMAQRVASVDQAIPDPDADPADIPATARNRYLEAALDEGNPSKPLRAVLEAALGRRGAVIPAASVQRVTPPIPRKPRAVSPPKRRLRVYALDPSIGKQLESVAVHQATLSVPWDDDRSDGSLLPGPVGEYLEVVDVDPASNRVYDPVDLNNKLLLAQDGLAPSEGNPQFHQQMVYAVAMATIGHFERALGRRALWAPRYASYIGRDGDRKSKGYEVPRLRIYPHGLRMENAYYSPDKKALLFGYFPADSDQDDTTAAGSMVFSCLSFDIIAHETSHALLDGLHRRFQEASNPDVPAFHEGFADIIALFQHFTMNELVSFEIGRTRGNLSAVNLLSGLALQFGEGSGRSGPLRDYAKPKMAELDYDKSFEPHDRGSILVFAVYDAFQAIIARRTESLIQLATGGSGVLPAGALHPGLVERLTEDIVKTARTMLDMCIRALDYCPAVDITFGEYLRAIITADMDVFPEDTHNYRLAFMGSFRKWKLLPRDVRTVSEETLTWDTPAVPTPWLENILKDIDLGWDRKLTRSKIFEHNEKNRWKLWAGLKRVFLENPGLYAHFGLLPDLPRFRDDGTLLKKPDKGGTTFDVYGVRPTRRVEPDGSFRTEVIVTIQQRVPVRQDGTMALDGVSAGEEFLWFRGGATVIIDPRKGQEEIRYAIIKNTGSGARQKRQAQSAAAHYMSPLRALYFGEVKSEPFALLHADHGSHDHG
ncbi:S8 family serine peptidase [Rhizobium sp. WSM1325]|uniref:S8 family serine peptidase n=1 Tax=Rhizobium sp. WSM1325 TaxID=3444086 RepID=UPI000FF82E4E|nr:S8 family serine peptidase [Rhizobium leguminosarum]RWY75281.1 peptidase S8 [Rhizobium leguminosarum]